MTLIYLVRHGETDWNREKRIQGSTDIPLNETGREQAAATGALLATRQWDVIVSSPLVRARETAEIIADVAGRPLPHTLEALVERRYGEAEGLTYSQVEERFPNDAEVPGRESRDTVAQRVIPALISMAEQHRERSIVVVSHGGVIRALLLHATTGQQGDASWIDPIRNGSVHSFAHTDGTLDLIAFDDPIEAQSADFSVAALSEQNAVEQRETDGH